MGEVASSAVVSAATAVGIETTKAAMIGAIAAGGTTTALNVGAIEKGKEIVENVVE